MSKTSAKNYYQILEVSPDASQDEIRNQYHFLVQAWHPDKFRSPAQKAKAEEKIKEINAAYEILGNPSKRQEYDWQDEERSAQRREEAERRKSEEAARHAEEERLRKHRAEAERREQKIRDTERQKKQEEAKQREQQVRQPPVLNPTREVSGNNAVPLVPGCLSIVGVVFFALIVVVFIIFFTAQSGSRKLSITNAYLAPCAEVLTQSQFEQMEAEKNLDYYNCIQFTVQNDSDSDVRLGPNSSDLGPLNLGIYPLFRDESAPPQYSVCSYSDTALLVAHSSQTYICHWVGTFLPGTTPQGTLYLQARFVDSNSSSYVRLKYSINY